VHGVGESERAQQRPGRVGRDVDRGGDAKRDEELAGLQGKAEGQPEERGLGDRGLEASCAQEQKAGQGAERQVGDRVEEDVELGVIARVQERGERVGGRRAQRDEGIEARVGDQQRADGERSAVAGLRVNRQA
jgi:hypothetical protein